MSLSPGGSGDGGGGGGEGGGGGHGRRQSEPETPSLNLSQGSLHSRGTCGCGEWAHKCTRKNAEILL